MVNLTANITRFPYPTNITHPINDLFAYTFLVTNDVGAFAMIISGWVLFYLAFKEFPNSQRAIVASFVAVIISIFIALVDHHLSYLIAITMLALIVSVLLKTQE